MEDYSGILDPAARIIVEAREAGKDFDQKGDKLTMVRKNLEKVSRNLSFKKVEVHKKTDIVIPSYDKFSIPVRLYYPDDQSELPVLIFSHGGGFVSGSIDTHDSLCRKLAVESKCLIASVNYRLAPEHKYPKALEDVYSVKEWVYKNANEILADRNKIAVGGDSAGGNLSIACCLLTNERSGKKISYLLLINPATELYSLETQSYKDFESGFNISKEDVEWGNQMYFNNIEEAKDIYASPLRAKDLKDFPPTFMLLSEFDILRDEGLLFAKKLKDKGIDVKYTVYDGMIHDFIIYGKIIKQAEIAINEIADNLKMTFY